MLGALVVPVVGLRLGAPAPAATASSGPAREALDALAAAGIGAGVLSPEYVLVTDDRRRRGRGRRPSAGGAGGPGGARAHGAGLAPRRHEPGGRAARRAGRDGGRPGHPRPVRAAVSALPGARVGGVGAQGRDFVDAVYGNAPLVLA